MRVHSSYKLIFAGILATLLVIGVHDLLPEKRLMLHPGAEVEDAVYSDEMIGGASRATWIDQEQLHWRCDIKDGGTSRFCGLHLVLFPGGTQGRDLSGYNAIRLKLNTHTTDSRVRIFFRNFERGFSEVGNMESAKFLNVLVPIGDLSTEVSIDLQEFSVAEWWINEWNAPRDIAYPKFDDIRAIGIDLGVPPALGVHDLQLESMYFVGEWVSIEDWYRGILFLWIAILTTVSLARYVQLRRSLTQEREQLQDLVKSSVELTSESEKLRRLSTVDKLTGALNRHGLEQAMQRLQASSSAEDNIGLLIIDLDHFKRINDNRGHDVGDKVLMAVAEALRNALRKEDHVVRWGGEEFVVLCPRIDQAGALTLAEKLRLLIADLQPPVQPPLRVTVSVGVGTLRADEDFDAAFKRVDTALYRAKHNGRNQVVGVDGDIACSLP